MKSPLKDIVFKIKQTFHTLVQSAGKHKCHKPAKEANTAFQKSARNTYKHNSLGHLFSELQYITYFSLKQFSFLTCVLASYRGSPSSSLFSAAAGISDFEAVVSRISVRKKTTFGSAGWCCLSQVHRGGFATAVCS